MKKTMSKPAPSPAERMDDAEFERLCASAAMHTNVSPRILAEARRARQSEEALIERFRDLGRLRDGND